MRGACRICQHPKTAEITAALILGKPLRAVAKEFSLKTSTLGRHARKHVQGAAKRALERVTVAYSRDLQRYMRKAQEETMQILSAARVSGNSELALQAVKEIRENTETMRRLLTRTSEAKASAKPTAPMPEIEVIYQGAREDVA